MLWLEQTRGLRKREGRESDAVRISVEFIYDMRNESWFMSHLVLVQGYRYVHVRGIKRRLMNITVNIVVREARSGEEG